MSIWTPEFWKGFVERVISTAGQAFVAILITQASLSEIDWAHTGSVVGLAALLSAVKNIVTGAKNGTTSVGAVERPAPPKVGRHGRPA